MNEYTTDNMYAPVSCHRAIWVIRATTEGLLGLLGRFDDLIVYIYIYIYLLCSIYIITGPQDVEGALCSRFELLSI